MDYFGTPKNSKSDDLEVTGVSRSGRVRKKSSKLVDFESPDDFTEHKLKKQRAQQHAYAQQVLEKFERQQKQKLQNLNSPQQTNSVHQTNNSQRNNSDAKIIVFDQDENQESSSEEEEDSSESDPENANGFENDDKSSGESSSDDDIDTLMEDQEMETEVETTGFTKLEPPEQIDLPSQAKSSLYMLEKYKKKLVIKDGKVINKSAKTQRKDKGKTRFTAYMLWAKDARQKLVEQDPNLDFSSISKKLGEMWASVSTLEKYHWRRRAKRMAINQVGNNNDKTLPPAPNKFRNIIIGKDNSSVKKVIHLGTPVIGNKVPISPPANKAGKDLNNESALGLAMYKVSGTQPIDIAAHLSLLGESLTIIGKRLKEHEGQITVSGSLSLLLDSLLCAIGPLLCLTQQIPAMNGAEPEVLSTVLENVAYIMPGL